MRRRKQLLEHMPRNLFELLSVFGVSEVKKNKAKKKKLCHHHDDHVCRDTAFCQEYCLPSSWGPGAPTATGKGCCWWPYVSNVCTTHSPSLKRGGTRSLLRLKPEAQYLLCICIPRELPSPGVNEDQAFLIQRDTVEFSNPNHLHLTGWCV